MDAGALAGIPLRGTWRLDLGLAGADMVSSLTWSNGLVEQQPAVLRVGAAVETAPGTWLAFEEDQLQTLGEPGVNQWRAGIQLSGFDRRIALRGGATQEQQGDLYAILGVGLRLPTSAHGLEVDYALLLPVGTVNVGEKRQDIGLMWRFGGASRPPLAARPQAALGRSLTDREGSLRYARIALSDGPEDAADWALELRDRHGRLVLVSQGLGTLPPGLDWDGRDLAGNPVQVDGLTYRLRIHRGQGVQVQGRGMLTPLAAMGLDADLFGVEGSDLTLRRNALAAVLKPTVYLKGLSGPSVADADFDLRGLPGAADATAWEVRIVDASGRTVRSLRGKGHPPLSLRWHGNDDLGAPAQDTLGTRFEVRITGSDGKTRLVAAAPLISDAGFAELYERVRKPLMVPHARLDLDGASGLIYTFYFDRDQATFTDSDRRTLASAADAMRARGLKGAMIDGHASRAEGPRDSTDPLSQARADTVLKALLERGIVLDRATSRGWADTRPATKDDSPTGRALNQRAVLRLESAP